MMSSFKPLIALISSDLFILFELMLFRWLRLIVGLILKGTVMVEVEENVAG